jgi:hypothetical protein
MGGPGRKENLKPKTSAKARGRLGGIKSGKSKRIKKLMSEIYADLLADQSGIKKGQGIPKVVEEILNKTDAKTTSARVALLRELREGTEGSKIKTETVLTINTDDEKIQQILKEHGINKSEPEN